MAPPSAHQLAWYSGSVAAPGRCRAPRPASASHTLARVVDPARCASNISSSLTADSPAALPSGAWMACPSGIRYWLGSARSVMLHGRILLLFEIWFLRTQLCPPKDIRQAQPAGAISSAEWPTHGAGVSVCGAKGGAIISVGSIPGVGLGRRGSSCKAGGSPPK